jgi:hypothetical protein
MGLLHHLSSYRLVAKIPSSPKLAGSPRYSFTVKSVAHDPSMPRSLGAVRVLFENKTAKALYITILDLSSAYGVSELFPGQFNQSCSTRFTDPRYSPIGGPDYLIARYD